MKKTFKYTWILVCAIFLMASCDLDLVPSYAIVVEEGQSLIESKDNLEKMSNGVFTSFRSCLYEEYSISEEVMCDGFNATVDYGNRFGGVHRMDSYFGADDYNTRDMWLQNFWAIKNYNVFLSALEIYDPDDAALQAKASVNMGETYFFRAFAYMQLVRHFGKHYNNSPNSDLAVPLILVYDQQEKPARATVKQVYDQIKADLDAAASRLSSVAGSVRAGTPTIDAVNAMYARYYLDIADYTNATAYAERVINSAAGYKLASTVEEMEEEYRNDNGTEPIFQLYESLSESGHSANTNYTAMSNRSGIGIVFNPDYLPSQKLINLYDAEDVRFKVWYTNDAYPSYLGGGTHRETFYVFTKYLGNPALRTTDVPNARQKVKPLMIGEMYLTAAEAYAQLGNADAAKTHLNALQTARGAETTDATMENIKNEWFKETVGEGIRLTCIKRWKEGFSVRTPQAAALSANILMIGSDYGEKSMSANDFHLVWPVPVYEMQINDNLVQNEGYSSE